MAAQQEVEKVDGKSDKGEHLKKDCSGCKGKETQKLVDSSNATVKKEDNSYGSNALPANVNYFTDKWLIDSGCSRHTCPYKEWFASYQSIDGGNAYIGNNAACKAIGIGTVKIKMDDGIVRTLTGVIHVPQLQRCLISVGALDSLGYKTEIENGALKVVQGPCVFMKGKKIDNVYVLLGHTVTNSTTTSTDTNEQMYSHEENKGEFGVSYGNLGGNELEDSYGDFGGIATSGIYGGFHGSDLGGYQRVYSLGYYNLFGSYGGGYDGGYGGVCFRGYGGGLAGYGSYGSCYGRGGYAFGTEAGWGSRARYSGYGRYHPYAR